MTVRYATKHLPMHPFCPFIFYSYMNHQKQTKHRPTTVPTIHQNIHVTNVNECLRIKAQRCTIKTPSTITFDLFAPNVERALSISNSFVDISSFIRKIVSWQYLVDERLYLEWVFFSSHQGPYSCKTCGATFKTRPNLLNHEPIHNPVKNHNCTICKQSFAHKTRYFILSVKVCL